MRKTAWTRLVTAGMLAWGMVHAGPATAQGNLCGDVYRAGLEAYAKTKPYLKVGKAASKAWDAYVKAPDDDKLEAVLESLADSAAGILIPGYGRIQKGGKLYIQGVEYTIAAAKEAQLDAFLCGGASAGESLAGFGFFQTNGAQAIAPGIDCRNFSEKVTTLEDFARLETLFKGFYTRQFLELGGPQNRENYQRILNEEWEIVDRTWKAKVAAGIYEKLRADLIREAQAAAQAPCPAEPAAEARHYQLAQVEPKPNSVVPEWQVSVGDGNMMMKAPFGQAVCNWSALPDRVEEKPFSVTLNGSATSTARTSVGAGLTIKTGFGPFSGQNYIEARAEPFSTAAASLEVTVNPTPFDFAKPGDLIYVLVSGCDAGEVVYTYEFAKSTE